MSSPSGASGTVAPQACRCGCETLTRPGSLYRPGHDARHAAAIGRHIIALDNVDESVLAQLPSPALQAKTTDMLDRARAARGRVHAMPAPAPPAPPPSVPTSSDVTLDETATGSPDQVLDALAPGHSTEQQTAETFMRETLAATLGAALRPARIRLPSGAHVHVDAVSDDPPVLAELWAHQGPPKGAQHKKVLADALKLHHLAGHLAIGHRLILGLADPAAARDFTTARTWYADALRTLHIEVLVIDLPDDLRATIRTAIRTAQHHQRR